MRSNRPTIRRPLGRRGPAARPRRRVHEPSSASGGPGNRRRDGRSDRDPAAGHRPCAPGRLPRRMARRRPEGRPGPRGDPRQRGRPDVRRAPGRRADPARLGPADRGPARRREDEGREPRRPAGLRWPVQHGRRRMAVADDRAGPGPGRRLRRRADDRARRGRPVGRCRDEPVRDPRPGRRRSGPGDRAQGPVRLRRAVTGRPDPVRRRAPRCRRRWCLSGPRGGRRERRPAGRGHRRQAQHRRADGRLPAGPDPPRRRLRVHPLPRARAPVHSRAQHEGRLGTVHRPAGDRGDLRGRGRRLGPRRRVRTDDRCTRPTRPSAWSSRSTRSTTRSGARRASRRSPGAGSSWPSSVTRRAARPAGGSSSPPTGRRCMRPGWAGSSRSTRRR